MTTTARLHRLLFGLLAGLSLLVSPVAACVCSQHIEHDAVEISEHQHDDHHATAASDGSTSQVSGCDECTCVQPLPKALNRADALNLQAEIAALPAVFVSPEFVAAPTSTLEVAARFDAVRQTPRPTSTPSRGPPVS